MIQIKRFQVMNDATINTWLKEKQEEGSNIIEFKYVGNSMVVIYDGVEKT